MFDRRNLASNGVGTPVYKFEGHKAAVLCVQVLVSMLLWSGHPKLLVVLKFLLILFIHFQWSPDKSSVFGSSAEDGLLNIWDYEKVWICIYASKFNT